MPPETAFAPLCFGRFEIHAAARELRVDGAPAELGARAFDLLSVLAERRERVVTKHELLDLVWPGLVVEENNIAAQISALRKVIGGGVIATIPGRGYRFTAAADVSGGEEGPRPTPAPTAPETATATPRTNLPGELTPLLGRAADLAALSELIDQHRLVSVVGAGGMGKTLLCQHLLAQRKPDYRHGVCWVELAHVTDAEALPAAIAAALGVQMGSGDAVSALCAAVATLDLLLALDNVEQVVDGVASLCAALRDAAPSLRLLVTTQVPLKLAAEWVFRLDALAVPQGSLPAAQAMAFGAVALFVDRARAADARFVLSDAGAPAVIELCRHLDGLALAIELAAARAPMLGVPQLVNSLADRLKLLTRSRNRVAPARQQTLRAALAWSHGFLDERERRLFRRLAVFAGSASLSLIQQVATDAPGAGALDEWAVLDDLSLLVDRSLVSALISDEGTEPRYRLLESPRAFALERLQEAGEHETYRARHARAVALMFQASIEHSFSGEIGFDAWREATAADVDNGREALAWARAADDAPMQAQIASLLVRRLPQAPYYREYQLLSDVLAGLIERLDRTDLLAQTAGALTQVLWLRPVEHARDQVRRCLARMPTVGKADEAGRFWRHWALCALAQAESTAHEMSAAQAALAEARLLEDPGWPPQRRLHLAAAEGVCAFDRADRRTCLEMTRRFAQFEQDAGQSLGFGAVNLVDTELAFGDAATAVAAGTALLARMAAGRDEGGLAFVYSNLGAAWLVLNDRRQALPHLRSGWKRAPRFGLQHNHLDHLALLAALDGRHADAARLAGRADAANAAIAPRQHNEAAAIDRATRLAREALGDDEFDRLHAEGASLRDADVATLAFGPNNID